jgi:hypothetical protein
MVQLNANQNKNYYRIIAVGVVLFCLAVILFVCIDSALAQPDIVEGTEAVGEATGLTAEPLSLVIGRIIRIFLSVLGVIALIIVLYGGFIYMTAGGDADRVAKAKKILINGLIGLIIILSAYAITSYIINRLMEATGIGEIDGIITEYQTPGLARVT